MEIPQGTFLSSVNFGPEEKLQFAGLAIMQIASWNRMILHMNRWLHASEMEKAGKMGSDIRRSSFIHGRAAAKLAIARVFPGLNPSSVNIVNGALGEPLAENPARPFSVSIAHSESHAAGLCYPKDLAMGIDIETPEEKNGKVIASVLSEGEKELLSAEGDQLSYMHVLWTAKEAAGKALGKGFRLPMEMFEIERTEVLSRCDKQCYICHFRQLKEIEVISRHWNDSILSLAFPSQPGLLSPMKSLLKIGID